MKSNFEVVARSLIVALVLASIACKSSPRRTASEKFPQRRIAAAAWKNAERPPRADDPAEQAAYYLEERLGPRKRAGTKNAMVEIYRLYQVAQKHLDLMKQYSTRERMTFQPRTSLRRFTARGELSAHLMANLIAPGSVTPLGASLLGTWQPLGPASSGGRTRSLLVDPRNPNLMYAGSAAGGVWRSMDGGNSWTPFSDTMSNIAVSSLAMDPNDSSVLYAGTGEGYQNFDAIRGAGIFKYTTASGWNQLTSTNSADFAEVSKLVVSPYSSSRVYAATGTGVFRSTDGGKSWGQAVVAASDVNGCMDLAIQPKSHPAYVYASCGNLSDRDGAVWRAVDADGPQSWQIVLTAPDMGRTSLAVSPSMPNVIYAASASLKEGPWKSALLGVYRSISRGDPKTWATQVSGDTPLKRNAILLSNANAAFWVECHPKQPDCDQFVNQGWYDNVIAVDPTNPKTVWLGGVDLFRSDDWGVNWGLASYWWTDATIVPQTVHADQHVILFHPGYNGTSNQTIFVGNDGGVWRTDNAKAKTGTTIDAICGVIDPGTVKWSAHNKNYGVVQFYHGLPYPDGTSFLGGTQDNGTFLGSLIGGADGWQLVQDGDGGFVAIDVSTKTFYAEYTEQQITRSVNGKTPEIADDGLSGPFRFITPFVMDPKKPQRLWLGGNRIFRTDNGASNWNPASRIFDSNAYPEEQSGIMSAIAVSPLDSNLVVAGFAQTDNSLGGWIHRTDQGLTANAETDWPRTIVRPHCGPVSSLAFDPVDTKTVYATYSWFDHQRLDPALASKCKNDAGHVFKSIDGGATWKSIDGKPPNNVPDIPVHSIVVDPSSTQRLYIGTDMGVFTSLNGGQTWNVENTGFPNVVTNWLALNTTGKIWLYAFTHGRGAWRVDLK